MKGNEIEDSKFIKIENNDYVSFSNLRVENLVLNCNYLYFIYSYVLYLRSKHVN